MKSPAKKRRALLKYAREAGCASDARSRSARKYARGGGRFAKLLKFAKLDAKLLEHNFFCFAKNRWMPSWFGKLLEMLAYSSDDRL
jgi:hypothetical protein